ncbi:josephin 1 2 [Holotrichia oblita]|uniref:Josephin 1 2 n=1 Tax=Holotrichia oblita TaxID=644536 RepID=A0ACB9T110_HOLOL|nr:josephin 1 2 [Holotrichia oblita]
MKEFLKEELDSICYSLSPDVWINPHKSILGLGNYDINVLMKALQSRGYEVIWFDKRKDPNCINLRNIFGFILNVPSEYKVSFITLPLRRRHWIAIRQINGNYYNLDSKLDSPCIIGRVNYRGGPIGEPGLALKGLFKLGENIQERDAQILLLKDIASEDVNVTINPLCDNDTSSSYPFS